MYKKMNKSGIMTKTTRQFNNILKYTVPQLKNTVFTYNHIYMVYQGTYDNFLVVVLLSYMYKTMVYPFSKTTWYQMKFCSTFKMYHGAYFK